MLVDLLQRRRLELEKLHQLRSRTAEKLRSGFQVKAVPNDSVERLGQQSRKVLVARIDSNPLALPAASPQSGRSGRGNRRGLGPVLNGKADSQPEDGLAAVFVLVSPLIGFR